LTTPGIRKYNITMAHIQELFPTLIYMDLCDQDISSDVEYILNSEIADVSQQTKDNYGHRSKSAYVLNDNRALTLRNWIVDKLDDYAKNVLGYDIDGMGITQSWLSIKDTGHKHIAHKHPNSLISGVFYFEDSNTPILFTDDYKEYFKVNRNPEKAPHNIYNVMPKKYGLILFPSHLEHEVVTNDNENRYSMSINSLPLSKMGSDGDLTEIDYSKIMGKVSSIND